jgi:hypothetical protein
LVGIEELLPNGRRVGLADSGAVPVARRSGKRTGHGTFEEISARKTIKKPGVGAPGFLEFLGKPLAEGVRGVVR